MDLSTQEMVGWNMSIRHTQYLTINASVDGFKIPELPTQAGPLLPRAKYCCKQYLNLIRSLGAGVFMSTKASPWENGYQESFFNNCNTDLGLEFDRFS